jgi:azurin
VRKAAVMVLPPAQAAQPLLAAGVLQDPDLHTRLAAVLAVADVPTSPAIGQALYAASQRPENFEDRWLSRAIYIAANRHQKNFTTAYHADPNRLAYTGLPISLRLGTMRPDWRAPADAELSSEWKNIEVPGNWESRGLPDFDGVVWFTRTLDWTAASEPSVLSVGPVRNSGEVWVNGLQLTPTPFAPAAPGAARGTGPGAAPAPAGGRGPASATFALPPGTLRPGKNTITVRIQNARNDGGFIGAPETMFIQAGDNRTPLAGTWKYRIERQTNAGAFYTRPGQLAAHVAFTAEGGLAGTAGAGLPPVAPQAPDIVLRLSVIPNQLKFDLSELTVAPGQLVEVVFTNPDVMQHNFVLGAPGSLTLIGKAADQLATSPAGAAQGYVPDLPQVIFATKLLDPEQTVTFQFKAPTTAGQYPYVCTFPSHWQVMNGVLNVVMPAGGRGGRGRGGL